MSWLVFWLAENILLFAGFNEAPPSVDVMAHPIQMLALPLNLML